jgi:hypothetical protein
VLDQLIPFADHLTPFQLLVVAICALVLNPVLTVLHELGHAAAAVVLRPGHVGIQIGARRPVATLEVGRLIVAVHPFVPPWGKTGYCVWDRTDQRRVETVGIALAGPAVELCCGGLALLGFTAVDGALARIAFGVTAILALYSALASLAPITYRDKQGREMPTDGALALAALRGQLD